MVGVDSKEALRVGGNAGNPRPVVSMTRMTWPTLRPGEEVMLGVREGEGVKEGVPVVVVLLVGLGVGESEPVGVPETLDPAEGVGV